MSGAEPALAKSEHKMYRRISGFPSANIRCQKQTCPNTANRLSFLGDSKTYRLRKPRPGKST
ncbi:hypothetical protein CNECB9_2540083 [Cupriavidus necator]|uniref:Uncharacterized protein n=1 Tax=Cupriavidus necator TaxID=106590 RepID=A0A1K0JD23_CUPNE|nr:hypothetical protein CNECB9_2540083 [Cupriavidus necator]